MTTIQEKIKQTKKKIYVAMFGDNFVNVEKLVPAEDKEVEEILTSALQRMQGEYVGQNKRIAYQLGFKEGQEETAEKICIIIDKIESQSETTLEEWKEYKHIRNAIRDKFILREKINE